MYLSASFLTVLASVSIFFSTVASAPYPCGNANSAGASLSLHCKRALGHKSQLSNSHTVAFVDRTPEGLLRKRNPAYDTKMAPVTRGSAPYLQKRKGGGKGGGGGGKGGGSRGGTPAATAHAPAAAGQPAQPKKESTAHKVGSAIKKGIGMVFKASPVGRVFGAIKSLFSHIHIHHKKKTR